MFRFLSCALVLFAATSLASAGTLLPGQCADFGNIQVCNLEGATGNIDFTDNGITLVLVVHDGAYAAALKHGTAAQSRRVTTLVFGGGYYAQGNISYASILVAGDNAVALSLALRKRHQNNGNTIEILGNNNLVAAARWFHRTGEVSGNRVRFGSAPFFTGNLNDAYLSGSLRASRDVAWLNRSRDVLGTANRTLVFDGFPRPAPDDGVAAVEAEEAPSDLALDAEALR